MATKWLESLKAAQKTCLVQDGRRKIHYTFSDGKELAEEYDIRNNDLIIRKWRKKGGLGGDGKWEYEVGEQLVPRNLESEGFVESSSNPIFTRKDTGKTFQWRIRNLPYPLEVYDIKIDEDKKNIIVRTTNKKYYKKFSIPDLERAAVYLNEKNLSFAHANNTLILTYEKPQEILDAEKELHKEFQKLKTMKDGDVECNPS